MIARCHPDRGAYAKGLCRACYLRTWQAANPERQRVYKERYAERHPEKVTARKARRAVALAATHDERITAWRARQRADAEAHFAERFWSKVDKTGDCWLWTASRDRAGYGRIGYRRGPILSAHRVAWELINGPIPAGLFVCHHCDNPPCVRPDHLFLGTQGDNLADMRAKGRAGGQFQPGNYPARWLTRWLKRGAA